MNDLDFKVEIYPHQIMQSVCHAVTLMKELEPPKCVFIPSRDLCRKMIRALVKYGGNTEDRFSFFLRFGLVDNPLRLLPPSSKRFSY
jgi:hypothetical protein